MPNVNQADQTGALGVTLSQLAVEQQLEWIFRREEHRDTGLDAHVEVVLEGKATGLVLGLQIKAGASYFNEPTANGWRYRGDYDHLQYWQQHNLEVVVVVVNVDTGKAYWAFVGAGAVINTANKSWTIEILGENEVTAGCRRAWMDRAFAADPRDALYRYCVIQDRYIKLLNEGGRMYVEAQDWVNKTRGQAEFNVICEDTQGTESEESFLMYAGVANVHSFVQDVFPWADVGIDEEFYDDHEDIEPKAVFQDDDEPGGYFIVPGERPSGIRPYGGSGGGEVENYRFELSLNEIGRAFATLNEGAARLRRYPPYYLAGQL